MKNKNQKENLEPVKNINAFNKTKEQKTRKSHLLEGKREPLTKITAQAKNKNRNENGKNNGNTIVKEDLQCLQQSSHNRPCV